MLYDLESRRFSPFVFSLGIIISWIGILRNGDDHLIHPFLNQNAACKTIAEVDNQKRRNILSKKKQSTFDINYFFFFFLDLFSFFVTFLWLDRLIFRYCVFQGSWAHPFYFSMDWIQRFNMSYRMVRMLLGRLASQA